MREADLCVQLKRDQEFQPRHALLRVVWLLRHPLPLTQELCKSKLPTSLPGLQCSTVPPDLDSAILPWFKQWLNYDHGSSMCVRDVCSVDQTCSLRSCCFHYAELHGLHLLGDVPQECPTVVQRNHQMLSPCVLLIPSSGCPMVSLVIALLIIGSDISLDNLVCFGMPFNFGDPDGILPFFADGMVDGGPDITIVL